MTLFYWIIPLNENDKKICDYLKENVYNKRITVKDIVFENLDENLIRKEFSPLSSIYLFPVTIRNLENDEIKKIKEVFKKIPSNYKIEINPVFFTKQYTIQSDKSDKSGKVVRNFVIFNNEELNDEEKIRLLEYFIEVLPYFYTEGCFRSRFKSLFINVKSLVLLPDFSELEERLKNVIEKIREESLKNKNRKEINLEYLTEIEEKRKLEEKIIIKNMRNISFNFLNYSVKEFLENINEQKMKEEINDKISSLSEEIKNKVGKYAKDEKQKEPSYGKISREFEEKIPEELRKKEYTLKDIKNSIEDILNKIEGEKEKNKSIGFEEWLENQKNELYNFCKKKREELSEKYEEFKKSPLVGWNIYLISGILLFFIFFFLLWGIPLGSILFKILLDTLIVGGLIVGSRFLIIEWLFDKVETYWKEMKSDIEDKLNNTLKKINRFFLDDVIRTYKTKLLDKLKELAGNFLEKIKMIEECLKIDSQTFLLPWRNNFKYIHKIDHIKMDVSELEDENIENGIQEILYRFSFSSCEELYREIFRYIRREIIPLCGISGNRINFETIKNCIEALKIREEENKLLLLFAPKGIKCDFVGEDVNLLNWDRKEIYLLNLNLNKLKKGGIK